ncbi:MAG: rod shape-determining protein MreC [Gemmatimonadetes bacterium]|nr:rod shape-determining protein MreC [Gemmatimonadota bacterium]
MAGQSTRNRAGSKRDFPVIIGLVLTSLILLNLPESAQRSLAHSVRQMALSPFIEVNGMITRAEARARDFDVLRAQMDSLMALIARQRTLAEENRQLRGVLSLRQRMPSRFVAVTVVRAGTSGSESVFQIDAGEDLGIQPFNAVVTEGGLLGQVQVVFPGYALAYDWSHRDFRVSAMTVDGQEHGIVEVARGAFRAQDRLVLRGASFLSDLPDGVELLTSGRGGAFPRGIRIGHVSGVAETSAGWSKSYYVVPSVYPGEATHAVVDLGMDRNLIAAGADTPAAAPLDRRP